MRQRKRERRLIADKLDRRVCGETARHAKDVGHANLREALDTRATRTSSTDDAHEFRLLAVTDVQCNSIPARPNADVFGASIAAIDAAERMHEVQFGNDLDH